MNRVFRRNAWLICLFGLMAFCASAQKGGGAAAAAGAPGGQAAPAATAATGASAGLQGLSFTPNQWPYLDLPNPRDPDFSFGSQGRVVVCYRLAKGNSATQPFALEPINSDDVVFSGFNRPCGDKSEGNVAGGDFEGDRACKTKLGRQTSHWNPCSELQRNPTVLKANQMLLVGIDISDLGEAGPDTRFELTGPNQNQLKLFNINVTNQQGTPINPAPVRNSFPLASGGGGSSGAAPSTGQAKIVDTNGFGSEWIYIGTRAPRGATAKNPGTVKWQPNHPYINGDIVSDATGVDFYRLKYDKPGVDKTCMSKNPPPVSNNLTPETENPPSGTKDYYCSGTSPLDPFPPEQAADRIVDGQVVWQESSEATPNLTSNATIWMAEHKYEKGAMVCVLRGKKEMVTPKTNSNANFFYSKIDTNKPNKEVPCPITPKSEKQDSEHLHYYFAVKAGKSGEIPQDPFSVQYLPRVVYLPWPYLLPGDAVPTFNVNLVYTPPTPGAPWQGNLFYPAGSVVTPGDNDGHYYTALTGGFSDIEPREPKFAPELPREVPDGSLIWLDSGTTAPTIPTSPGTGSTPSTGGAATQPAAPGATPGATPAGAQAAKPMLWMPLTHFSLGDTLIRPESGHYFAMVASNRGTSGTVPAAATTGTNAAPAQPRKDPFPPPLPPLSVISDNEIKWTKTSEPCSGCLAWQSSQTYFVDNLAKIDGYTYIMTGSSATSGKSGLSSPFHGVLDTAKLVPDNEIQWRYASNVTCNQPWKSKNSYSIGEPVCRPDTTDPTLCADHQAFVVERVLVGKSGTQVSSSPSSPNPAFNVQDGDLIWTPVQWADVDQNRLQPSWAALTPFYVGDFVKADNGQYYKVIRSIGGVSSADEPKFPITFFCTIIDPVIHISDGLADDKPIANFWQDMGPLRPRTGKDCSEIARAEHPKKKDDPNQLGSWKAKTPFNKDQVIFVQDTNGGRYYKTGFEKELQNTGGVSPFLNLTRPMVITWQDAGTSAPPSVASGQPADQTVSLINLTLTQTHSLARFNIAAGAEATILRPPTFGWVSPTTPGVNLPTTPTIVASSSGSSTPTYYYYYLPASQVETTATPIMGNPPPVPTPIPTTVVTTGAGATPVAVEPKSQCTYGASAVTDTSSSKPTGPTGSTVMVYPVYECPSKTSKGTWPVDAVLVVTAYLLPVDEEVPWQWKFWRPGAWRGWVPAPSFGMSLTNPTSNFYVGASEEFGVRNLQLYGGFSSLNLPSKLAPYGTQQVWGGQGVAPTVATTSAFLHGGFFGVTFNLSNFISSLFTPAK